MSRRKKSQTIVPSENVVLLNDGRTIRGNYLLNKHLKNPDAIDHYSHAQLVATLQAMIRKIKSGEMVLDFEKMNAWKRK